MASSNQPKSCDTFVALPPCTANGCVVFGKNSDRHENEVQEIIYRPAAIHGEGDKLQVTYILILFYEVSVFLLALNVFSVHLY